jgi:hypothetical protein
VYDEEKKQCVMKKGATALQFKGRRLYTLRGEGATALQFKGRRLYSLRVNQVSGV